MKPTLSGQIVQFHSPLPEENPNQQYVVLDIIGEDNSRAKIQALNTGLPFPPISVVSLHDLTVVPISTDDLVGYVGYVQKDDGTRILGKIVSVDQPEIYSELKVYQKSVQTNVVVTIEDNNGQMHSGSLVV